MLKKYCVPARNTHKVEGKKLICTHIFTWFQRGACVSKPCIPALNASLSSNPSDPKNIHFYCILAWMPRKSANTSIVFSIFSHTLLLCSSTFYLHFHYALVLFVCISLGFLDWEAFWTALGCFWGAQLSGVALDCYWAGLFACISTVYQHCLHAFLFCMLFGWLHLFCIPALHACISTVF